MPFNMGNIEYDEADTVAVGWVPLFHDLGLVCYVLGPVLFGYHSILMPPMLFMLRPVLWLQTIAKFRGTYSAAPNFAYELCIKLTKPEQKAGLDLSSWRVAGNGGELVRKSTLERFAAAFKNCGFHINAFYPTLGLAESVLFAAAAKDPGQPPVSLCLSRQSLEKNRVTFAAEDPDAAVREVVSCGRTGSHHEIAIVDPVNGRRCESGEPGEIWLRGPSIAQGYWNRAAESRQTFGGELADRSGQTFLRTGDMGFLYEGQLYIVGRYKEMIICRGKNIFPQDIEILRKNPTLNCDPAVLLPFPWVPRMKSGSSLSRKLIRESSPQGAVRCRRNTTFYFCMETPRTSDAALFLVPKRQVGNGQPDFFDGS